MLGNVKAKHADYVLLACSFVTGLLDCSTFNNWSVFVGMQTGMTHSLALYSFALLRFGHIKKLFLTIANLQVTRLSSH